MAPPDWWASTNADGSGRTARVAPEHGVERPACRRHDAQRHEGVHGGRPVPSVADGRPVERPRSPGQHRGGQGDEQPLPVGEAQSRDEREGDREVTQRHEENGCDDESPAERACASVDLGRVARGLRRVLDELGRVADVLDLLHQPLHWQAGQERDPGPFRRVVDIGLDTIEVVEPLLDPSRAGPAGHAADGYRHHRFPRC